MKQILVGSFIALLVLISPRPAAAQSDDWKITVYPILAWVPIDIKIDVNVPPIDGGGGSGGGGGKIVDGRFDGAFFGGGSAAKGKFRIDADLLWAAVGGDRVDNPVLHVDVDAIYLHASGGFQFYPDFFVTGGVRRMALKYDINLAGRDFERKPGFWDPLIGVAYHHIGKKLETHATFEGGGFGVGADSDFSAGARLDWKPTAHFGLAAGYNFLKFNLSNTVATKTFTAKQTMHGPVIGIGLYF